MTCPRCLYCWIDPENGEMLCILTASNLAQWHKGEEPLGMNFCDLAFKKCGGRKFEPKDFAAGNRVLPLPEVKATRPTTAEPAAFNLPVPVLTEPPTRVAPDDGSGTAKESAPMVKAKGGQKFLASGEIGHDHSFGGQFNLSAWRNVNRNHVTCRHSNHKNAGSLNCRAGSNPAALKITSESRNKFNH